MKVLFYLCPSERSEESHANSNFREILHYVQDDKQDFLDNLFIFNFQFSIFNY